jgi:hypothetical protein
VTNTDREAARRREWPAAYRDAAERLTATGQPHLYDLPTSRWLARRAIQIEAGQLTPWADAPEPSAAPAQPAQDAPAAAVPTLGTQADLASVGDVQSEPAVPLASAPTGPVVLGRALLDRHGTLWQDDAPLRDGVDMLKAGATYVTRSYAEKYGGPLRPVLLLEAKA